ncbi:hypothetical protein GW17_00032482 [Ensete ventricosum]|nr:hypothetical protein GW17_00032482 [Ensete ventricosum]
MCAAQYLWAVRIGPSADRYVDPTLPGGTIDWGCFCPKKREKNKREKKNLESRCSSPALSVARGRRIARTIRRPWLISSPAGDFFSPHGEKKCLPAWEEGTRQPIASQIDRIARVAFEVARKRHGKLCSVDKANVLEASMLWRKRVNVLASEFPDVELSHMYVDNAAMQLIRNPKQDKANPLATVLSAAMLLRYGLGEEEAAKRIEAAVINTLNRGFRTGDIYSGGTTLVGCKQMGEEVLRSVEAGEQVAALH